MRDQWQGAGVVRAGREKESVGDREKRRDTGAHVEEMRSVCADEGVDKRHGEKRNRMADHHPPGAWGSCSCMRGLQRFKQAMSPWRGPDFTRLKGQPTRPCLMPIIYIHLPPALDLWTTRCQSRVARHCPRKCCTQTKPPSKPPGAADGREALSRRDL